MDIQKRLAGLILGFMAGAVALGIPYAISYQSLSDDIDALETELSDETERADFAEQRADDAGDVAEQANRDLQKQERTLEVAQEEVQTALEEAAALISSQRSHIFDLEGQLARSQRRPSGVRCSDGLSVNEIVSGHVDPCSEWEFDY